LQINEDLLKPISNILIFNHVFYFIFLKLTVYTLHSFVRFVNILIIFFNFF